MDLTNVKLPKKITPCPIVESVVELRFESGLPPDVIAGMAYSKFKDDYPKLERLSTLDIPASIRDSDPNLRFTPCYRLVGTHFIFQIGPRSFSVLCPKEYQGWATFSQKINSAFKCMSDLDLLKQPLRLGLRYVSFFENLDIFSKLKLELNISGSSIIGNQNIVRTEFIENGYSSVLQIANNTLTNTNPTQPGSIVDIDIFMTNGSSILANFTKLVEGAHEIEKKIFFSILDEDFLKSYNPEY